MLQLRLAADDVIKGFALPQAAAPPDGAVDVEGAAAFPMPHDLAEQGAVRGLDNGVDVIRHDAPHIEHVGGAVACLGKQAAKRARK